ncbi:MAG: hypothetical protein KIT14_20220 [bacterium]|nr:hypothetical protein [bacterium]
MQRPLSRGLLVALLVLGTSLARATDVVPRDAELERTDGGTVAIRVYRGKPAVLFYEDRRSTELNAEVKAALWEQGRAAGRTDAVYVVAIANIQAYDFFPAKDFAVAFIRRLEGKIGIPILLDARGVLSQPPWDLPSAGGSVVLLDADGRVVWQHTGALGPERTQTLLARVASLLPSTPTGDAP